MKRLFYYLSVIVILYACDSDNNPEDEFMKNPFRYSIELSEELQNQITEIVPGVFYRTGRYAIGTSKKTSAGFDVYLQNPLNPIYLYPLKEYVDFRFAGIDNDIMCYGNIYLYAYNGTKSLGAITKSYTENDDPWAEDNVFYDLNLMYVTDDTTVKAESDILINGVPFYTYNLNLKKGWNAYVHILTHKDGENYHEFTSELPDFISWKFF